MKANVNLRKTTDYNILQQATTTYNEKIITTTN